MACPSKKGNPCSSKTCQEDTLLPEPELDEYVRPPCMVLKNNCSLKKPKPPTPVPEPEMPENVCPCSIKPPCGTDDDDDW